MSTIQLNDSLSINISTKCSMILDDTSAGLSIFSIILLSNFVVGLPANVWTVWLICQGTRELLASEIYLLSLAGCEVIYCLGLPAQLYCMYSFKHTSPGLTILLILQSHLVWICRPMLQFCICLERYIAVVHPLIFIRFKPPRYKVAFCALAWCFIFLIVLLSWTLREDMLNLVVFIWFVPMMCMFIYFYFSVLCSLKHLGPGKGRREGKQRKTGEKIKRKAFNINLVHLLCFMFNYLLPVVVRCLGVQINISPIVTDLSYSLGLVCGHIQAFFYLHRVGKLSFLKRSSA